MPNNQTDDAIKIEIKDEHELKNQPGDQVEHNHKSAGKEAERTSQHEAAEEKTDYHDQYIRLQAEFQNYKRRSEQRMQEWRMYAAKDIVSQLLPVIDDFDILFSHHQDGAEKLCVDGVKMIYNKMLSSLKDIGLQPIDARGAEFDPNMHEAVMAQESDEVKEGHVLRVWQQGFMYKDQLLRPAKVITAKAKQNGMENVE